MSPLESRFVDFVRSLKNAEVVDEIELSSEQKKAKKPDFFFCDRQFIGEMKAINADTEYKAIAMLEGQRERPEFPVFYEPWDSNKILNCLPDGKFIKERMIKAITTGLEKSLKKANKQIESSKQTYKVQTAEGILIIINDLVEVLSPEVIAYRVNQLLNRRRPSGELFYPDIAVTLIVSGLHIVKSEYGQDLVPVITFVNSNAADYEAARDYTRWLERRWAEFNGMPFIESNIKFDDLKTLKRKKEQSSKQPTRSDFWKKQYKIAPYLRGLSEDELIGHAKTLAYKMLPRGLRGDHEKPSQQEFNEMMESNTHLMEEFNHRGIDFRKLSFAMKEALKQLQQDGKVNLQSKSVE
jgi:hypothetical protein